MNMKGFLAIVLAIALVLTGMWAVPKVYAAGTTVGYVNTTLVNTTPTVTTSNNGTPVVLDYPITNWACDIVSAPATTLVYSIQNNIGSFSTTTFDSSTTGLITSGTCTTSNGICTVYATGKIARVMRAVYSTPTTSASKVTINCAGVQ